MKIEANAKIPVSGFAIVKNGQSLGYPYLESLKSLAPLVDEIVIAHGDSTDETLLSLKNLAKELPIPLRIIDSPWNSQNLKKGLELSRQTNIALGSCQHEICFYLQSDEVLHDEETEIIRRDLQRFASDPKVSALAFHWVHFYGSTDYVVHSRKWYRREIRVVKKSAGLQSVGDAQGFRQFSGHSVTKPDTALSQARVLHYGWTRPPDMMVKKTNALDSLWGHQKLENLPRPEETIYSMQFGIQKFTLAHPKVMDSYLSKVSHKDPFEGQRIKKDFQYYRMRFSDFLEKKTGLRIGEFKNYRKLYRY